MTALADAALMLLRRILIALGILGIAGIAYGLTGNLSVEVLVAFGAFVYYLPYLRRTR